MTTRLIDASNARSSAVDEYGDSTRPRAELKVGVWKREPPGAVTSVIIPVVEYHVSRFCAPVAVTTTTPEISCGSVTQLLFTGRVTAAPGGKSGLISSTTGWLRWMPSLPAAATSTTPCRCAQLAAR